MLGPRIILHVETIHVGLQSQYVNGSKPNDVHDWEYPDRYVGSMLARVRVSNLLVGGIIAFI